jgi:hypothetical protein
MILIIVMLLLLLIILIVIIIALSRGSAFHMGSVRKTEGSFWQLASGGLSLVFLLVSGGRARAWDGCSCSRGGGCVM